MRSIHRWAFLTCAAAVPLAGADVVIDWNETLLQAIRNTNTPPPRASRAMAMVHTAIYDSVNSVIGSHEPYHILVDAPDECSAEAAAAKAAHTVLVSVFPTQTALFDGALTASLAAIPDGLAETNGVALGQTVGQAILTLRANDNSTLVVPFVPTGEPGDWEPTPPANAAALLPNWPLVTCWAMENGSQFRPPAPPNLSDGAYLIEFNEVKQLGGVTSTIRTAEQTQIAQFWADGGGTETPPGHWNSIAQSVSQAQGLSLAENARLFAKLNIALADAAILAWDCKYAYSNWRPVTGIRKANLDGNPLTTADPNWTLLITTPPFPAYTSGHSTFSSSAATILASFFGTDNIAFSSTSDGLVGVTRNFQSFSQAALEAGMSRIYGGIHWQSDNQFGLASGAALGQLVASDLLLSLVDGDVNQDGCTNDTDLGLLLANFGCNNGPGNCTADLDGDGAVNDTDLGILLNEFGQGVCL